MKKLIEKNAQTNNAENTIKKNENWYEAILYKTTILQIEKIDNLMTCE